MTLTVSRKCSPICSINRSTVPCWKPRASDRKSCSAIPIHARTAASWRQPGVFTVPSVWSPKLSNGGVCSAASSMAVAVPLAAVAGPRMKPFWPSHRTTVRGQIKFTEQGEVLFYRYNNMETAVYELTMGVTGLIKASLSLIQTVPKPSAEHLDIMGEIARLGERSYRNLTEESEGFLDYFYEATPVSEIGQLNIGSRPSHRKKQDRSKNSVRAIAWVFAWAQSRQTFPAWYGIGSSLATWCAGKPERLETLRHMYREWPFFRNLLSNAQMALAKSNMNIAREYAGLCPDAQTGKRIWEQIAGEYQRSVDWVLDVARLEQLVEENPALAASLQRRDAYLGPLNYLQVNLIRKVRAAGLDDTTSSPWMKPLLRTINAIAAGMRNTG